MEKLKGYLLDNFEQIVVCAILVSALFLHYFVQQKMAFLNFYYLPVLFAGYFLGRRTAVLASFFCILLVVIFFMATPHFFNKVEGNMGIILNLTLWGSFLMLTSYVTGTLFEHKGKSLQDLKNAYIGVLEILSKYLEASDRYTMGHSIRVSQLATEIAIAMQLPRAEIENVKAAALLHDIGKVDVSMDLIQKASSLSTEEKKAVDIHTEKGVNILSSVGNILNEAVPMVKAHHKYYEELGNDKSLPNDAKIGACIIAVADTYDAIITDRPYRAGKTPSKALEEIEKESGKQFHPEVVKAFKRVFESRFAELADNVFSLNK
jgi:putative nucleotidyltransferase with HDIG domain